MQLVDFNAKLIIRVALDLLTPESNGVRTSQVASDPRVQAEHQAEVQEHEGTFRALVGKTLSRAAEVRREDDAPNADRDVLWVRQ